MDVTPGTGPAKGARAKIKVPTTPAAKEPAAKPRARKTAAPPEPAIAQSAAAPVDMTGLIATTAYFIAEERNFAPGHELDDWLEAERRVLAGC